MHFIMCVQMPYARETIAQRASETPKADQQYNIRQYDGTYIYYTLTPPLLNRYFLYSIYKKNNNLLSS